MSSTLTTLDRRMPTKSMLTLQPSSDALLRNYFQPRCASLLRTVWALVSRLQGNTDFRSVSLDRTRSALHVKPNHACGRVVTSFLLQLLIVRRGPRLSVVCWRLRHAGSSLGALGVLTGEVSHRSNSETTSKPGFLLKKSTQILDWANQRVR
jgi:hypothetical protein